jgi:hypothetical protein
MPKHFQQYRLIRNNQQVEDMEQATPRSQALQQLIAAFISNRLTDKLEKLSPDDPKRSELNAQYQPTAGWPMPPGA